VLYPDFDLPCADGTRLRNEDLAGRPWFAYMARHPGCYVCQHRLAEALELRPQVQALGGDIVVFFNAQVDYTKMWVSKSDLPGDLKVVMDPDAELYEAIGTIRGRLLDQALKSAGSLWRSRGSIAKWKLSSNDMMRMGADVAIGRDGEVALLQT
jgi:peroxiredoxin